MRPITDLCSHWAVIFDKHGWFIKTRKIKYRERTFKEKDFTYNFVPDKASFMKVKTMFSTRKYYMYNLYNPNPILLNGVNKPLISADTYTDVIEANLIKQLNDVQGNLLKRLLTPRNVMLALVIILVIYYFASGGTLT